MIQIDGTDYEQPTDKAVIPLENADYLLTSVGDAIRRVETGDLPEEEHDHADEEIRPSIVYTAPTSHKTEMKGYAGTAYVKVYGPNDPNYKNWVHIFAPSNKAVSIKGGNITVLVNGSALAVYNGNVFADGFYEWGCSATLKDSITPIENATDKVLSLNGIEYTQGDKEAIGVVAEELEALGLPGLVIKNDAGEYEGVNLVRLSPLLIEAFKEQETRILAQETRIDELEARIAKLEKTP